MLVYASILFVCELFLCVLDVLRHCRRLLSLLLPTLSSEGFTLGDPIGRPAKLPGMNMKTCEGYWQIKLVRAIGK